MWYETHFICCKLCGMRHTLPVVSYVLYIHFICGKLCGMRLTLFVVSYVA